MAGHYDRCTCVLRSRRCPGDASATGVCEAAAGLRSDDACVVARVPLALLGTCGACDAHVLDIDSASDTSSGALGGVAFADDVPVDPVFLSFDAKRALFEGQVSAKDVEHDRVVVSVSFMDGAAASFELACPR